MKDLAVRVPETNIKLQTFQFSSTAPKDTSLSQCLFILMVQFRWILVGLVLIYDHNGDDILSDLREEINSVPFL
ncbi:hypothetical protein A6R68_21926, partial [Neotoma lepida]